MSNNNYNIYNELTSIMDISGIVQQERIRLDQKSAGIKSAIDSQNRMIFLNQSYANRMKEYSYMVMIIALTIICVVFTLVFKNFIPTFLVNILLIIFVSVGVIWSVRIYMGIISRDNVDFDKIYSLSPDLSGNAVVVDHTFSANGFSIGLGIDCIGSDCCADGLVYDPNLLQCIIPTVGAKSPFTSIQQAYRSGELSGNNIANSNLSGNNISNYNNLNSSLTFTSYP